MLYYNLERIYKARGIEKPYSFLIAHGFSERYASLLSKGRVAEMKLKYLEKACEVFNCTPNDVLVWEPDKNTVSIENHPLSKLRSKKDAPDVFKEIRSLTLEEIDDLQEFIKRRKEQDRSI